MSFAMSDIAEGSKRGWTVRINGQEQQVAHIEISSSQYGALEYGRRPEGYDAWVFREKSGGGAVTLPYAKSPNGEIYVGLLLETRANMGPVPVLGAMGGFVNQGESHAQAQARRAEEESGLDTGKAQELPGVAGNCNRAFFVADANAGEGIHAYCLEIEFDCLQEDSGALRLKEAALIGHKKASDLYFLPWREAVRGESRLDRTVGHRPASGRPPVAWLQGGTQGSAGTSTRNTPADLFFLK